MQLAKVAISTPYEICVRTDSATEGEELISRKGCGVREPLDIFVYKQSFAFWALDLVPYLVLQVDLYTLGQAFATHRRGVKTG